jgi:hypothetical protein
MAAPNRLPTPAVTYALRRLLPSAAETLLLRAALDREQGAAAWSSWRAQHDLPATLAAENAGLKGLLPLLAYQLETHGASVAPDDLRLLRMARYHETLRSQRYQTILGETLTSLTQADISVILLKGAALAPLYPAADLRHSHDIDLLILPQQLPDAVETLLAHGYSHHLPAAAAAKARQGGDLRLDHSSGLPVVLHTQLYRNPFYAPPLADAWRSATPLANHPANQPPNQSTIRTLAPEWELVHILGVMLCAPQRARVTWVCDAYYLLAAQSTLDWQRAGAIAGQSGLAMAAAIFLAYLEQQQQAPIPAIFLAQLQHDAAAAGRAGAEQLLHCSHDQGTAYNDLYAAAADWQERAWLLRWIFTARLATLQRRIAHCGHASFASLQRRWRAPARQPVAPKPTKR